MRCPNCHDSDTFNIEATTVRRVSVDRQGNVTEDDGGDITWEEDSPADCGECAWSGTVKDLETGDEEEEEETCE